MQHNIEEVATLAPDYLGFIFYKDSDRNFENIIPKLNDSIKKVGVFVNASAETILTRMEHHQLDVIQLHGDESPAFCELVRRKILETAKSKIDLWKVFSIDDTFQFEHINEYNNAVDKYLFDTKTMLRGGSGQRFDWSLLQGYRSEKPVILSGGIGPEHVGEIKSISASDFPLYAIDLNSRFEVEAGLKDVDKLKFFINEL